MDSVDITVKAADVPAVQTVITSAIKLVSTWAVPPGQDSEFVDTWNALGAAVACLLDTEIARRRARLALTVHRARTVPLSAITGAGVDATADDGAS